MQRAKLEKRQSSEGGKGGAYEYIDGNVQVQEVRPGAELSLETRLRMVSSWTDSLADLLNTSRKFIFPVYIFSKTIIPCKWVFKIELS